MRKGIAAIVMVAAATVAYAPTRAHSEPAGAPVSIPLPTMPATMPAWPPSVPGTPATPVTPTTRPTKASKKPTRSATPRPSATPKTPSKSPKPGVKAPVPVPKVKPIAVAVGAAPARVRVGAEVSYRIAVTNQGDRPVQLAVEAYPPAGLRELRPAAEDGRVLWWVTLGPGAGQELRLTGRYDVAQGEPAELVACAYPGIGRTPLACGSRIDLVEPADLMTALAWLGAGAGGTALIAGLVFARRRRPNPA